MPVEWRRRRPRRTWGQTTAAAPAGAAQVGRCQLGKGRWVGWGRGSGVGCQLQISQLGMRSSTQPAPSGAGASLRLCPARATTASGRTGRHRSSRGHGADPRRAAGWAAVRSTLRRASLRRLGWECPSLTTRQGWRNGSSGALPSLQCTNQGFRETFRRSISFPVRSVSASPVRRLRADGVDRVYAHEDWGGPDARKQSASWTQAFGSGGSGGGGAGAGLKVGKVRFRGSRRRAVALATLENMEARAKENGTPEICIPH